MEKGRMNPNNKRLHKYSCENGALTLEWVDALAKFLKQYEFLWSAHVVNFFQGRLWEALDKEWMECLREETVENLLLLPSGIVQGNWPDSLKEFVHTAQSLALPREAGTTLEMNFPGLSMPSFGSVLAQGMNSKKRHEVEILAAVIQRVANEVEANDIIDVGAGQGYLAQVLSFEYRLSVIALDASAYHSTVTRKRAERIKKHYQGRMQKSYLGHYPLSLPQTVTCCVPSGNSLTGLSKVLSSSFSLSAENCRQTTLPSDATAQSEYASFLKCFETERNGQTLLQNSKRVGPSLVLAGLHACGDLSVTMLRTFLECEEVKALISVGCCYNLLSEGHNDENLHHCAFPMSNGVKILGLPLGKNGRDLACQSAERWKSLTPEAAMENFEVHAFRAAFQMVLHKFYPMVAETSPSVGRLGKARRRQKNKGAFRCRQFGEESLPSSSVVGCKEASLKIGHTETSTSEQLKTFATNFDALRFADVVDKESTSWSLSSQAPENPIGKDEDSKLGDGNDIGNGLDAYLGNDFQSGNIVKSSFSCARGFGSTKIDTSMIFNEYSMSALGRLGLPFIPNEEIFQIWKEVQPNAGLIGPYWSLRAVLGPLLETFLLLDRLLFLQEKSNVAEAIIIPLFNPCISPRNMAIVARKVGTNNLAQ